MPATVIPTRFRLRRDTAANWTAANPVLLAGEPALETDTGLGKTGDGSTAWNALLYTSVPMTGLDAIVDGQVFGWDAAAGRLKPIDAGKVYQEGNGISIANPTSATPTISSTLGSIALSGRVATYSALPIGLGSVDAGKAYLVDADGLIYVWDGAAWPADGIGAGGSKRFQTTVFCATPNTTLLPSASVGPGLHALIGYDTITKDDLSAWDAANFCYRVKRAGVYYVRNGLRANQTTSMEILVGYWDTAANGPYSYSTATKRMALADSLIGNSYYSMSSETMWPAKVGDVFFPGAYSPVVLTQHSITGIHYGFHVVGPF